MTVIVYNHKSVCVFSRV